MKKESLSIIAVKTLLAVIIFAGVGTIIIGGGLLIEKDRKVSEPIEKDIVIANDKAKDETEDNIADWKIYRNEEHGFEMKYPKDWDYTVLESPNNPTIFAPQNIIVEINQSLKNIKSDKSLTLMVTFYDKILFEGGILPYKGKSNEYIQVVSSDVDVDGNIGAYYISEYIKDKSGYKTGEKKITVDLAVRNGYLSMHLFNYQYLNVFEKILSTFKFIEN